METYNVTLKIIFDIILTGLISLPCLILKVAIHPFQRGFYCNDESIFYPYKGNTVPIWLVTVLGMGIPFIVIVIGEFLSYRQYLHNGRQKQNSVDKTYEKTYKAFGFHVHHFVIAVYYIYGAFIVGLAINQLLTDTTKYMVGRLRPHFIAICKPNWDRISCNHPNTHEIIYIDYPDICTTTDDEGLKEARLSHPSGHSSLAMYSMMFLALYLQCRLHVKRSFVVRPLFQLLGIMLALYTCLSRISDYHHHWSDVLAGGFLGIVVAFFTVFYISVMFPRSLHYYINRQTTSHLLSFRQPKCDTTDGAAQP